ncbi:hypothetical protein K1719_039499 [Acacia pycnantha]|nr:hypothetical protein K1719_039499 [Acacia pycnantha]
MLDSGYLCCSIITIHFILRHSSCPKNVFFHFFATEFDLVVVVLDPTMRKEEEGKGKKKMTRSDDEMCSCLVLFLYCCQTWFMQMMMNQSLKLRKMVPYLIEIRLEEVVLRHLGAADGNTMIAKDVRFSMSGLMHQLDISQSLHVTHLIGRNGGRTQRKWSCISLWAKTMCHSTL